MPTLKAGSDLENLIKKIILDTYYPIGTIYLATTATNPGNKFGGTWKQVSKGTYLLGYDPNNAWFDKLGTSAGSNGKSGNFTSEAATGNTGSTTLTVEQIPSHSHPINPIWGNGTSVVAERIFFVGNGSGYGNISTANTGGGKGHTHTLNSHTHHHVNPFFVVCVWQRTA